MRNIVLSSAVGVALFGAIQVQATPRPSAREGHAERVYGEYAVGTGRRVGFALETVAAGSLAELAGKPLGDIVGLPTYLVEATQMGTEIRRPHYAPADPDALDLSELEATVEGFDKVGYPAELGQYRLLDVTVSIGSDVRRHRALEFCWASLGHCAVLDPSVVFLESLVNNRVRLAAEGWGPRLLVERNEPTTGRSAGAVCGLASNPSVKDRSYYWRAYRVQYKNIFGMTLVQKDLGAQKSGIRCDANCSPAPYGYSNVSSAWGTLGWNAACDNDFGYGSGGGSGKWISETKCTHRWAGAASANASVTDIGSLSVAIQWSVDGGVDQNGGQMIDTCGYY